MRSPEGAKHTELPKEAPENLLLCSVTHMYSKFIEMFHLRNSSGGNHRFFYYEIGDVMPLFSTTKAAILKFNYVMHKRNA